MAHYFVLAAVMRRPRISGKHWLVEFYSARELDDTKAIRRALRAAVAESGATLLKLQLHHFGPGGGVTGVALLAESHISIHTWPERGYAAVDIFMCGPTSNPQKALAALRAALHPRRVRIRRFERGLES
jgi:S-adenosylmethionine decarboxylase